MFSVLPVSPDTWQMCTIVTFTVYNIYKLTALADYLVVISLGYWAPQKGQKLASSSEEFLNAASANVMSGLLVSCLVGSNCAYPASTSSSIRSQQVIDYTTYIGSLSRCKLFTAHPTHHHASRQTISFGPLLCCASIIRLAS